MSRSLFRRCVRTLYASGREICVQKCVNAYQRKEIQKRMPHFKSTFQIQRNKTSSQTLRAFLSHTHVRSAIVRLRDHVLFESCWDRVPCFAYTVHIASMILRTARFLCIVYYTRKFACDRWSSIAQSRFFANRRSLFKFSRLTLRSSGSLGSGQTPYFTWAELNDNLGRPKLIKFAWLGQTPNLSGRTKLKTRRNDFWGASRYNENLHLVWLMWKSAFDPKSIFSRSSGACTSREERLSRSNAISRTQLAVLHMGQSFEFGSCKVRRLT